MRNVTERSYFSDLTVDEGWVDLHLIYYTTKMCVCVYSRAGELQPSIYKLVLLWAETHFIRCCDKQDMKMSELLKRRNRGLANHL